MKHLLLLIFLANIIFQNQQAKAQAAINNNQSVADASAILDVTSTTQGFLSPRLTAAQRSTLAAKLTNAQKGMEVADATTGKLYYWDSTQWVLHKTRIGVSPLVVYTSTNKVSLNAGTAAGDLISWDGNNWISTQPNNHFSITIDNRQPLLAINYCIALQGIFPSQNSSDNPFLGELELFAFSYAPHGFAFCNGQLLPINQNQALFSLLGTYYGGNGTTSFALPDLRSRIPVSFGQGTGLSLYNIGQTLGTESAILIH